MAPVLVVILSKVDYAFIFSNSSFSHIRICWNPALRGIQQNKTFNVRLGREFMLNALSQTLLQR
jgi:hypothetical protein